MAYKNPKCGIYAITHLPSGRRYVGQAQNIELRWTNHRFHLRQGTHGSTYLQRLWTKHGESQFSFTILQLCKRKNKTLDTLETHWFNLTKEQGLLLNLFPPGKSRRGFTHTVEARKKISEVQLKVGADLEERKRRSERAARQHAEGNLGRSTWSKKSNRSFSQKLKDRGKPVLVPSVVEAVLNLEGKFNQRVIAKKVGILQTQVSRILRNPENYGHPKRSKPLKKVYKRIPDSIIKKVKKLRSQGLSRSKVASVLGVAGNIVYRIDIHKYGGAV